MLDVSILRCSHSSCKAYSLEQVLDVVGQHLATWLGRTTPQGTAKCGDNLSAVFLPRLSVILMPAGFVWLLDRWPSQMCAEVPEPHSQGLSEKCHWHFGPTDGAFKLGSKKHWLSRCKHWLPSCKTIHLGHDTLKRRHSSAAVQHQSDPCCRAAERRWIQATSSHLCKGQLPGQSITEYAKVTSTSALLSRDLTDGSKLARRAS